MVVLGDNDTTGTPSAGGAGELAASPASAFAPGAEETLDPVSRQLNWVATQARRGNLRLDPAAAHRLLAALSELQARVHTMIANGKERIGPPLRFGDNFVARAMGKRLRASAVGNSSAAVPVLESFLAELDKLEHIVRRASVTITTADDDAKSEIAGESGEKR